MRNLKTRIGLGIAGVFIICLSACDYFKKNNTINKNKYEKTITNISDSATFSQNPDYNKLDIRNNYLKVNFTQQDKIKIASKKFPTLTILVDAFSKNINFQENENTFPEAMIDNIKQNYELEGIEMRKEEDLYLNYLYWDKKKNKKNLDLYLLLNNTVTPLEKITKEMKEIRKKIIKNLKVYEPLFKIN